MLLYSNSKFKMCYLYQPLLVIKPQMVVTKKVK
jgi:hypothetical protein